MRRQIGFICDECEKQWASKRRNETSDGRELCDDCYDEEDDDSSAGLPSPRSRQRSGTTGGHPAGAPTGGYGGNGFSIWTPAMRGHFFRLMQRKSEIREQAIEELREQFDMEADQP